MSDDKKLNLPALKPGGTLSVQKKPLNPLNLSKKLAVSKILGEKSTVQADIARKEKGFDLVLVGDLTGSMGAYHALLKEKFSSLGKELFSLIKNLRIGIIFYLDHGAQRDPYVTRVQPLSRNIQEIETFISATPTGHGGDEDEAVEDAFHDILNLNWREMTDRSVVLFGDAQPHEPGECPKQYDYFDLAQKMYEKKIIVNSVYCGKETFSDKALQKLKDVQMGDFSRRVSRLGHPHFFSWVANVTGGTIIGVEQIDDLLFIIQTLAAKDSGNLEKFEKTLRLSGQHKLNLKKIEKVVKIAKESQRRIEAQKRIGFNKNGDKK